MGPNRQIDQQANEAIAAWQSGDSDKAIAELQTLVTVAPGDDRLTFLLGAYLWNAGRASDAVSYLRNAAESQPESERVARVLFHALWESGDTEAAAEHLREFLAVNKVEDLEVVLRDVENRIAGGAS